MRPSNPRSFVAIAAEEKFRNVPWDFTIPAEGLDTYAASVKERGVKALVLPEVADEDTVLTAVPIAAEQIDADGRQWIEVLPTGEKFRNGPWYFTITAEDLETYAASVKERGDRTPIDYDHAGADGGSTRASGWFTGKAEVRGEGDAARLWVEVQWTPAAVEAIKAGEFRFVSPEFTFAKKDKKTGLMTKAKELLAATLTNRPFFKELAPVGAEVAWEADDGFERIRQLAHAALNPGPTESARYWVMDVAPGKALVSEYGSSTTWVVPFSLSGDGVDLASASGWTEAEQQWVEAAAAAERAHATTRPFRRNGGKPATTEGDDMNPEIVKALGLAEDADEDAVLTAVQAAKENADKVAALEEQVAELSKRPDVNDDTLKTLTAQAAQGAEAAKKLHDLERDTLLGKAVEDGKILPAQKDAYASMYDADAENVQKLLEATPARSFSPVGTGGEGPEGEEALKIEAARKENTQTLAGKTYEPDEESLKLDVRAKALLAEQGKNDPSDEDYIQALEQAERELAR